MTLSSAERYNLRTAALQTTSNVPAATQFTNADGRTFTAGDASSLKAAAEVLKPDGKQWNLDYKALSTARGAKAYPGALPVYATVPTSGLEQPVADKLTRFLCYSVDRGQRPGQANGQPPDGYLPITEANGLGAQRSYVVNAIAAVRQQKGAVPALDDRAGDASRRAHPRRPSRCRRRQRLPQQILSWTRRSSRTCQRPRTSRSPRTTTWRPRCC
ncbi:hypothetical protein [Aeromicrobium sp. UC242_57]|uniref:hypothetical protein n=1 Tax=Aeromicrobium sp. UC242_57 TaxID=3374624 RepID=UPI00378E2452